MEKNYIIILLLIWVCKGIYGNETFILQKLDNTGAFFEKISTAIFFNKQFDLITEVNIPETGQLTAALMECSNHLTTLCEEIIKEEPGDLCKPVKKEIQWHIKRIIIQNNKLQAMYGRQKRGLLDIGGKISKLVFGTMDSEDANKIYENLQNLQFKQTKLLELENRHVAVMKSNFDALSKPIVELQNETFEIEEKLNQLVQQSNFRKDLDRKQRINHQVAELSSLIMIQCLHINKLQEDASEIIASLENAKLHPLVIPFNKIINIIEATNAEVNIRLLQHQVLREITEVSYVELNGKIIVKSTIPMLEKNEYTLYKPYLIPFKIQGEYRAYEADAEFIAIGREKDKSIELHTWDVEKCKQINDDIETQVKICKHSRPIFPTRGQQCLPNLFINPLNTRSQCKIIPARPLSRFTKLTSKNTWLFSMKEVTNMIIECGNTTQTIQVENNGLLTFLTTCKVTTKDFIAEVAGVPERIKIEQPQIPIAKSNEVIHFERISNEDNKEKQDDIRLIDHRNHNKDFLEETKKINELKRMTEKIGEQDKQIYFHKLTNTTVSIAGIMIIIIITITIFLCKRRKNQNTHIDQHPVKIEIHSEDRQERSRNQITELKPQGPRII